MMVVAFPVTSESAATHGHLDSIAFRIDMELQAASLFIKNDQGETTQLTEFWEPKAQHEAWWEIFHFIGIEIIAFFLITIALSLAWEAGTFGIRVIAIVSALVVLYWIYDVGKPRKEGFPRKWLEDALQRAPSPSIVRVWRLPSRRVSILKETVAPISPIYLAEKSS